MSALIADLSALQQRKVAAIVGACIADAAAQPLHWMYNTAKMKSLTEGKEDIEFREPSANPFYRLHTGSNSCYGDQAYVMLKSLVESKGLETDHLTRATYDFFGPNSAYENDENGRYATGKEDKVNVKKTLPIHGPWRHICIKEFLTNLQAGISPPGSETDDSIDSVVRMVPLVSFLAGQSDFLPKVDEGLRVLQNSDSNIACALMAARILEQYILLGDPDQVLQTVIDQIGDRNNPHPQELDRATIGQLRAVIKALGHSHDDALNKVFKRN